jgi:hypothetical protein
MEETTPAVASTNPLAKHFRQPAIYFKPPSKGRYWPATALNLPPNGEIGVMSMTTKDEITLKTPDALLNGQGVVNVIESCCPAIKDAWAMPSIDVDAALIAIRIASYGNQMDFAAKCPHCDQSHDYAIDLGLTLASIEAPDYNIPLAVEDLKIRIHPQAYFSLNKTNMIAFEEQQILRSLSGLEDNPEEAKARFDQHLAKVIELNISLLANSTKSIEIEDGTLVTEPEHITEFYNNADNKIIKKVQGYLTELSEKAAIKPVDVKCLNEECSKGFPVNITFDYASFFA